MSDLWQQAQRVLLRAGGSVLTVRASWQWGRRTFKERDIAQALHRTEQAQAQDPSGYWLGCLRETGEVAPRAPLGACMAAMITLMQAEKLTGIPRATLRRWLESGRLRGLKLEGRRTVWMVEQADAEALTRPKAEGDGYGALIEQWKAQQASGYHTGKPIGHHAIGAGVYGLTLFWRFLGQPKSIEAITAENLRLAMAAIPLDEKSCHFSMKSHLCKALVSFGRLLVREGLMSRAELAEIQAVRAHRVLPVRKTYATAADFRKILDANKALARGRNEHEVRCTHVMLMLLGLAGLRRAEACAAQVQHLDLERGTLRVPDGKGHTDAYVPLAPSLADCLRDWLPVKGPGPWLLCQKNGTPLGPTCIRLRLKTVAEHAGLDITPHGLRRTCATLILAMGGSQLTAAVVLRHKNIRTTAGYTMLDFKAAHQEMQGLGL